MHTYFCYFRLLLSHWLYIVQHDATPVDNFARQWSSAKKFPECTYKCSFVFFYVRTDILRANIGLVDAIENDRIAYLYLTFCWYSRYNCYCVRYYNNHNRNVQSQHRPEKLKTYRLICETTIQEMLFICGEVRVFKQRQSNFESVVLKLRLGLYTDSVRELHWMNISRML